jgi:hypothetical protein
LKRIAITNYPNNNPARIRRNRKPARALPFRISIKKNNYKKLFKQCRRVYSYVVAGSRLSFVFLVLFCAVSRGQDVSTDRAQLYTWVNTLSDRWNAHDIEGYMAHFWRSDNSMYIVDGEIITGWGNLLAAYRAGYSDVTAMGTFEVQRIEIQTVTPDVALIVDWWTAKLPMHQSRLEHGTTTFTMRKFNDGWKAVGFHTSFMEL